MNVEMYFGGYLYSGKAGFVLKIYVVWFGGFVYHL